MVGGGLPVWGSVAVSLGVLYLLKTLLSLGRKKVSVKDKVVLITGASSGLGEACAHVFFRAGAKLILGARRQHELERVKQELLALQLSDTHEPYVLPLDLGDLTIIPAKAAEAKALHGMVDILINNGGLSYRGEIINTELDVDTRMMTVNYLGQVCLTKALLGDMIKNQSGHIVALSSVQGKIAIPYRSAYGASKHAFEAFFDCLRAEVAEHKVKVTVLSPGYINTNLSRNALTGDGSQYGVLDSTQASGMSPGYVAERVLQAIRHQENEVILAPLVHRLAVVVRAIAPDLFHTMMASRAAKLRRAAEKDK